MKISEIKYIKKAIFNSTIYNKRTNITYIKKFLKYSYAFFTNNVIIYPENIENKIRLSIGFNNLNRVQLYAEDNNLILSMNYDENSTYKEQVEQTYDEVINNAKYFERLFTIYINILNQNEIYNESLIKSYIKFYKTLPEITDGFDIYKITECDDLNNVMFYNAYEEDHSYCFGEINENLHTFVYRTYNFSITKNHNRKLKLSKINNNDRKEKVKIILNLL